MYCRDTVTTKAKPKPKPKPKPKQKSELDELLSALKDSPVDLMTFAFERKLEEISCRVLQSKINLRYPLVDRVRLYNLRQYSVELHWPLGHMLKVLVEHWTAGGKKRYKTGAGLLPVPPVVLVSERSLTFLCEYRRLHSAEIDEKLLSRETSRAAAKVQMLVQVNGPDQGTSFDSELDPIANYRIHVDRTRRWLDRLRERLKDRSFPGNPFDVRIGNSDTIW